MLLLQLLLNGLQLGAIYALTAVGFALIFGSTKVFHVAHGAAFTLAGYIFWWSVTTQKWHWAIGLLLAGAANAVQFTYDTGISGSFDSTTVQPHVASIRTGLTAILPVFHSWRGTWICSP